MLDWDEIVSVEEIGEDDCFDISLLEEDVYLNEPNYIVNDFVVHNSGMADSFCKRKRGEEKYEIHPLLKPILDKTYGIQLFQEQVMQILNVVGDIPQKDCLIVQKAISKKKVKEFSKYKEQFIKNGQKNLGWTKDEVEKLWDDIEVFSGYGFNKCLAGSTKVMDARTGDINSVEHIFNNIDKGVYHVHAIKDGKLVVRKVLNAFDNGIKPVFEVKTFTGKSIKSTKTHRFLTFNGYKRLSDLQIGDRIASPRSLSFEGDKNVGKVDTREDTSSDILWEEIVSIEYFGEEKTYDLEIEEDHNFVADMLVVHNSHSCAYTYISSRLLDLKAHYPLEFYCAILMEEELHDKIKEAKVDAKQHGVEIMPVNLNKSKKNFTIIDDKIYYGFGKIKGIGAEVADRIVAGQPYSSFKDFLDRFGTDAKVVKPLIALGLFEDEGDRVTVYKFYEFYKKREKSKRERTKRYENSLVNHVEELKEVIPEKYHELAEFTDENIEKWKELFSEDMLTTMKKQKGVKVEVPISRYELLLKVLHKREKATRNFDAKVIEDQEDGLSLDEFNPDRISLDKETEQFFMADYEKAQAQYYGFYWKHPIERAIDAINESDPDVNERVYYIDEFLSNGYSVGPIDVMVLDVKANTAKNGKTKYYQVFVEDAYSKRVSITFWEDDYLRFEKDLFKDSLLRIQVRPPSRGYKSLTFDTPPRNQKHMLPKTKEDDYRIVVLWSPKEEMTLEEDASDLKIGA